MISEQAQTLMRRIVRPPKPKAQKADRLTAARAWGQLLPRVAEESAGLVATVESFQTSAVAFDDLLTDWANTTLAITLEGPGPGKGMVLADAGFVAAMVEVQTIGRVRPDAAPERPPTDADAALCAPLIDAMLDEVATLLSDNGQRADYWHCGRRITSPRAASLMFDDGTYVRSRIELSLADGAKAAQLDLCLPDRRTAPGRGTMPKADGDDPRLAGRVEMQAVLYRGQATLADLHALGEGSLLPLPGAGVDRIVLETMEGRPLSPARLGRLGPFQAVRIGPRPTDGAGTVADAAENPPSMPDMSELRAVPLDPDPVPELPPAVPETEAGEEIEPLPALADLPPLPDLPELPPLENG
ncbi:MAG: hypothetical protein AAFQ79_09395 [Pseudomonadota bacterium]